MRQRTLIPGFHVAGSKQTPLFILLCTVSGVLWEGCCQKYAGERRQGESDDVPHVKDSFYGARQPRPAFQSTLLLLDAGDKKFSRCIFCLNKIRYSDDPSPNGLKYARFAKDSRSGFSFASMGCMLPLPLLTYWPRGLHILAHPRALAVRVVDLLPMALLRLARQIHPLVPPNLNVFRSRIPNVHTVSPHLLSLFHRP